MQCVFRLNWCTLTKQSHSFCHNHLTGFQPAIYDIFFPTVHTGHLHRSRLRLAVYYLIYKYLILDFICSCLRNNNGTCFLHRYNHITGTTAMKQPSLIREYGTLTDSSRTTINHPANRLNSSLFRISGFVVQQQINSRHLLQCLLF